MYAFLFLVTTTFANTFALKGSANDFSLVIDARKIHYVSTITDFHHAIKPCNLPLARALNAELLSIKAPPEQKEGLAFRADGGTYFIAKDSKEGTLLSGMERRITDFAREEKTACK